MHPLAIAGFLSALGVAHAVVAAYCLFLYRRPPARGGAARDAAELVSFGLLNVALAALDGGLAHAQAAALPSAVSSALLVAEAGRIGAIVFLVHFVLQYARAGRPSWALPALYGAGGLLELGNALGALNRYDDLRRGGVAILGVTIPDVRAPAAPLGAAFSLAWAIGAGLALLALGRAFLRGRREAPAFVGMTLLAVAAVHDALRNVGLASGPPLGPLGYAAFVNGVMMTLLSRFAALRGQLEDRARELKDRARELARSYEELRAAQDELVRKEQLAAVGELSAVVAHEVRNPLAIITNAVATLRRPGIGGEDRDTLLQILEEETSRLNRLVGDLLRYARPVNLERQHVSLRDLAERGLALARGKVDLTAELVEPEPVDKVWADGDLIRQVIENLIDNAIQAMSGGGVLTVTLINTELEGARGVEIQIQDTGEGMDTQVRSRALDPFFTTRPSGTGLGLAIVARIVDAHGGVLRIKSKAGAGTVMHVFLPRSSETAPVRLPGRDGAERRSSEPPLPIEVRRAIGRPSR